MLDRLTPADRRGGAGKAMIGLANSAPPGRIGCRTVCRRRRGALRPLRSSRRGRISRRRGLHEGGRSVARRGDSREGAKPMIGRLNHVAIAVHDLNAASRVYRDMLGAELSAPLPQPEHGVTVVFITLPNTKVELLEPLGESSPIAGFLARNPEGGIHHICYEDDDIGAARDRLIAAGARVLGPPELRIGAHGKPVIFLHPKDFCGTLVELEQA